MFDRILNWLRRRSAALRRDGIGQGNHEATSRYALTGQEYEDLGDLEHGDELLPGDHPERPRLERLAERGFVTVGRHPFAGVPRFSLTDEGRRALREFDRGFVCSVERGRRIERRTGMHLSPSSPRQDDTEPR